MKKKLVGVIILGILIIIGSAFNILGVLWILTKNLPATAIALWGVIGKLNYLLAFPMGLFFIIFALGVLKLRDRSRKLLVYLCILDIAGMIIYRLAVYITLFIRKTEMSSWIQWIQWVNRETILSVLFDLLPVLIFIIYFTRPKVKEQFKP